MSYTFEILGVTPALQFFGYQQTLESQSSLSGVEYLASWQCTLDAFLGLLDDHPSHPHWTQRGWDLDSLITTVVNFWIQNPEPVFYWQSRLADAGQESLLVARIGSWQALGLEFEQLLRH